MQLRRIALVMCLPGGEAILGLFGLYAEWQDRSGPITLPRGWKRPYFTSAFRISFAR